MTDPGRPYEGVILATGTVHIADMDLLTTLCSGAQALDGTGTGLGWATCSRCIMLHRDRCAQFAVTAAVLEAMGRRNPPGIPPGSREHPGGPLTRKAPGRLQGGRGPSSPCGVSPQNPPLPSAVSPHT